MVKYGTGAAGQSEQTIHVPITLPVSLCTGHRATCGDPVPVSQLTLTVKYKV